jgi:hypothetical protein
LLEEIDAMMPPFSDLTKPNLEVDPKSWTAKGGD